MKAWTCGLAGSHAAKRLSHILVGREYRSLSKIQENFIPFFFHLVHTFKKHYKKELIHIEAIYRVIISFIEKDLEGILSSSVKYQKVSSKPK